MNDLIYDRAFDIPRLGKIKRFRFLMYDNNNNFYESFHIFYEI